MMLPPLRTRGSPDADAAANGTTTSRGDGAAVATMAAGEAGGAPDAVAAADGDAAAHRIAEGTSATASREAASPPVPPHQQRQEHGKTEEQEPQEPQEPQEQPPHDDLQSMSSAQLVDRCTDAATAAGYRRHLTVADAMHSVSSLFVRAGERIRAALEPLYRTESSDRAAVDGQAPAGGSERVPATGDGAADEAPLRLIYAGEDAEHSQRSGASRESGGDGGAVAVLGACTVLVVVLGALEAHEKPSFSCALGALGSGCDALPEGADADEYDRGRSAVVSKLARLVLAAAAADAHANSDDTESVTLRAHLPLGAVRVPVQLPRGWIANLREPVDAGVKVARFGELASEADDRRAADGGASAASADETAAAGQRASTRKHAERSATRARASPRAEAAAAAVERAGAEPAAAAGASMSAASARQDATTAGKRPRDDGDDEAGQGEQPEEEEEASSKRRRAATSGIGPEWTTDMRGVLLQICSMPQAEPFLEPVSERDAPGYHEVIKRPMDLGTVRRKLDAGEYTTPVQFSQDMTLIWTNAQNYNERGSEYWEAARALRQETRESMKPVLAAWRAEQKRVKRAMTRRSTAAVVDAAGASYDGEDEETGGAARGRRRGDDGVASSCSTRASSEPEEAAERDDDNTRKEAGSAADERAQGTERRTEHDGTLALDRGPAAVDALAERAASTTTAATTRRRTRRTAGDGGASGTEQSLSLSSSSLPQQQQPSAASSDDTVGGATKATQRSTRSSSPIVKDGITVAAAADAADAGAGAAASSHNQARDRSHHRHHHRHRRRSRRQ